MTFQLACRITALVGVILFVILVAVPGSYTANYGVAADVGGSFMGRRASPLFLGLAVLLWGLSQNQDRDVQRVVCICMIITFAGVALTGISAFLGGIASSVVLLAAVGELLIAVAFWYVRPRA